MPLADEWEVHSNTDNRMLKLIAHGGPTLKRTLPNRNNGGSFYRGLIMSDIVKETIRTTRESLRGLLRDPEATPQDVEAAFALAARDAVAAHKREGLPIAVWEDGKVVWIPAEEIPDFPEEDDANKPPENGQKPL
jgi:hypothetical protein